ncbi:GNAT family N-acetyltransferase [Thermocatellispora tengchongensis]|uniref:GNAT family N-acetyltransferase n=1 Tax=Thermocatellispora tengchongensis TaxID=1073253 RepID=UPI003625F8E8
MPPLFSTAPMGMRTRRSTRNRRTTRARCSLGSGSWSVLATRCTGPGSIWSRPKMDRLWPGSRSGSPWQPSGGGAASTPPPAKVAGVPKLAVIELILRKPYRGQGIGKRLLSTLLDGRAELYATLLSHPEAPAHALYERWGWEVAGTCRPAPDAPVMDIMILARKPHAPRSA